MKKILAAVLALIMVIGLAACNKPADNPSGSAAGSQSAAETTAPHDIRSDLNIALTDAPVTNDPHGNSKDMTQQLSHWINDGLILVEGDGTIKPGIANYQVSADGLKYTFTIRDGVKFHNGDAVTPEDVVWSIERCTDMAYYKNYTASFTDVKKTGDKEVTITLKSPDNALLYNLYRIKILSMKRVYEIEGITAIPKIEDYKDTVDADGKVTKTAEKNWKEAYYVETPKTFGNVAQDAGCGPFTIKSYDKDRLIELEKFEDYYDKANTGNIKTVKINIITENSTRYNALLTGDLDLVQVPSANWAEIQANDKFNHLAQESATICTMIVNHYREGSPLGDKRVRQAIRYALNRDGIIQVVKGMGVKAYTLYNPKYIIGSSDVNKGTYEFDQAKAKALLAEAGYANGFTLAQKFLVPKTGDSVVVAQAIQQMLEQVGIIVALDQKDSSTASTESKNGTQDLYLTNSNYVFHMSDGSRAMHSRTIKTQVAKYAWLPNNEGAKLDELYDGAQAATTDAERDRLYAELNQWLNDVSINIPIYYHVKGFAWDKNLDADLSNPYYLYIQYWNWK